MRSNTPARMHVVKKEEKEANLKAFILKDLEARKAAGTSGTYRVIARSLESPVARVVAAISSDIAGGGIDVRMVLTQLSGIADGDVSSDASRPVPTAATRILRDIRFLDAHEQLVVSATSVWIGDCMRREPSKRDAYECFAPDCAEMAGWATLSFERLWALAEPIEVKPLPTPDGGDDGEAVSIVPVAEAAGTHEASTRH